MSATAAATAAKRVVKFSSYFRVAGLTYLDQLDIASSALRRVLKEPLRSEALARSHYKYRDFKYVDGKELAPGEYGCDSWGWLALLLVVCVQ